MEVLSWTSIVVFGSAVVFLILEKLFPYTKFAIKTKKFH